MYASLIGAGVSQLYDLLQSPTSGSTSAASSSFPISSNANSSTSTTTPVSVSPLGANLNQLFVDLQASRSGTQASGSTDPTAAVANDLQSIFGELSKATGAKGHHHHHQDVAGAQQQPGAGGTASPFQSLASSLVAYAKGQSLGTNAASGSTLTA